jgi:ABC-2 type transport system ATP-binding protein
MVNQKPLVCIKNLIKTYPKRGKDSTPHTAVNNISFDIKHGEVLGLLGPNGAGKTTTIQMLLGTLTPTSGSITAFDLDFFTHQTEVRQRMGFASTYVEFSSNLTVNENLKVHGLLYGMNKKTLPQSIERMLKNFDVWALRERTVNTLSAGQKTRTMLATAFLTNPSLVLLDEPTASLDPDIAYEVRHFILEQQRKDQTTILITSHNMAEVEQICDRALVLKDGAIIANDTPSALAASVSIAKVQLNVGDGLKRTIAFAQQQNLPHTLKDRWIEIAIDEHKIADFLTKLAQAEIRYSEISIDKPTLEDYFLHIAKK